ncbi:uncharacterized protein [Polyergus mexicanus]|uniref:uncharacterized protein isoform X3 n=1 Tax=Polyergus mexicanus TaxID=615972 RepID=UPI0038B57757
MQQASVGGCDEDSGATSPPISFAIKSEPVVDRNDGVRIKIEMPEPTEAGVEVKGEPREDYQRHPNNHNYRYNDKKPGYVPDVLGQCQPPGYRPVGLPNSFGFPPFYGHHHHPAPSMMPAASSSSSSSSLSLSSFPTGHPSPDGPIGKIADGHERTVSHVERHAAYGRMPPIPNDGFLQEHHHRFDAGDFQHANAAMPYPGFRPTLRSSYGSHHHHHHHHHHHRNNSAYNRSGHYHPARQRKWSSAAFRGLHPPMPWPTWFFRPDLSLGTPLPTSHVPNSSNVSTSSSVPSRTHLDASKGPELPSNSNKVHGQTPTICTSIRCTINGCSCESFTPGKRHLRYCENCHHGWVPHGAEEQRGFHLSNNESCILNGPLTRLRG